MTPLALGSHIYVATFTRNLDSIRTRSDEHGHTA